MPITTHRTLEECIAAEYTPEVFDGDNAYYCGRCESKGRATRSSQLVRVPPVLLFQLNRFVYDMDRGDKVKVKHSVTVSG